MKKISSIILPGILMALFSYLVRHGYKDLFIGIYILFPTAFIIQGKLCSNSTKSFILGLFLSALGVFVPIFIWYHIADLAVITIIYILLGIGSFIILRTFAAMKEIRNTQKTLALILSFFFPVLGFILFVTWLNDNSPEKRKLGKHCLIASLFLTLLLIAVFIYGFITYISFRMSN